MTTHVPFPSEEPSSSLHPVSPQQNQFHPPSPTPPPQLDMSPEKQKDPSDSSSKKRSPEPIDNPPIKRPKEAPKPKRRLTWYDTIRDSWSILEKQNPGRNQFRMREIVKLIDTNWTTLRGEEKKQKGWRNQLSRAVRKEAMLTRVQSDGQADLYAMKDPDFQPPPSRPAKRSPGPENDTAPEESVYHLSIPSEWTAEAFKPVRISTFDKSAALQFISGDPNTIKGHKGYRMARATSGVIEGDWYFEATVLQLRDPSDVSDGAVRLGWSQRRSDVETPVGFDAYGFGIRDRTGEFIHAARLKPYGDSFCTGDVIGCRISLPKLTDEQKTRVGEADRAWLTYRFITMLQGQAPQDSGIDIINEGTVQFYKNGRPMGIPSFFEDGRRNFGSSVTEPAGTEEQDETKQHRKAKGDSKEKPESNINGTASPKARLANVPKREMKAGVYYPSISLYGNAVVQANFGPDFRHPLPGDSRPMCEAARESPKIGESEVIESVDDTLLHQADGARTTPDSVPHPQSSVPMSLHAEQDQVAREESSHQPNIEERHSAFPGREKAAEEPVDKHALDTRIETNRDIPHEGPDQPQPEPMAIEA